MTQQELELRIAEAVDEAIRLGAHPHHWPFQRIQARQQVIRDILETVGDWDDGAVAAEEETNCGL